MDPGKTGKIPVGEIYPGLQATAQSLPAQAIWLVRTLFLLDKITHGRFDDNGYSAVSFGCVLFNHSHQIVVYVKRCSHADKPMAKADFLSI